MRPHIRFLVPGPPLPFDRARKQGKRHFNADEYTNGKKSIALCARSVWQRPPTDAACIVRIDAYVGPPAKKPRSKEFVKKKPDVDNYAKPVLDALNELVWFDDDTPQRVTVTKRFSDVPYTVVSVHWLEDVE
jgi:Holliday junction resolvase RusA-like endonuclease